MNHLLEVCVDSLESALAAQSGGADRLELCANLLIGGTSPSPALIEEVLAAVTIPVNVLLRPRFGDFCFTDAEKRILIREVETCRDLGVHGVVLGALLPDGRLDRDHLAQCIEAGGPNLSHTLHRAFDLCRDPFEGLEDAVALGFDTILTSGQQAKAIEGAALLGRLVEKAAGRIQILAGSGVGPRLPGGAGPHRRPAVPLLRQTPPPRAPWSSAAPASPWACPWPTSISENTPTPPWWPRSRTPFGPWTFNRQKRTTSPPCRGPRKVCLPRWTPSRKADFLYMLA